MLKIALLIVVCSIGAVIAAMFFGFLAGVYQAHREVQFRRRALRLLTQNGQGEEFIILSGDSEIVQQVYQVAIATTRRVQEERERATNNEGIAIDDRSKEEQNTDRSGRA